MLDPRFHINNILVILSVQLFMFSLVFLGTLNYQLPICRYTSCASLSASRPRSTVN